MQVYSDAGQLRSDEWWPPSAPYENCRVSVKKRENLSRLWATPTVHQIWGNVNYIHCNTVHCSQTSRRLDPLS